MVNGMKFPTLNVKDINIRDKKTLVIAGAIVLVLILGLAVSLNGCGGSPEKVSKSEAEEAKSKGLEFYRQGKWDKATEELEKAVSGNPKDLHAHFQLAYSYEQNKRLDDAHKQYQEILKIDKNSADAHYNMGRILVQKDELDKAIAEFETAAKLNSNFTSVRAALAEAYTQKKEFEKALATYGELEKIISSDNFYLSRVHSAKGKIFDQMGKRKDAEAEFTKALELDENNKDAAAGLK